jgi:electron transfer flavoprotein alpha subunit
MTILLFVEAEAKGLGEPARRALTAARKIGPVDLLLVGADCAPAIEAASRLDGIGKVLVAQGSEFAGMRAEPVAATVLALMDRYDGIVAPATATAKSFMPRLAALLDVMQVSEAIEVLAPDTFVRPIYAGNFLQTVQNGDAKLVMTVRTAAFEPTASTGQAVPVETVAPALGTAGSAFVSENTTASDRPELASARVVVSGGRALGSKERFDATIGPLAAKLNAAIGASRAAVDAGFAGNDLQVGQTGKIVAPDLYIAIGISGAIQHLAGMKESKIIVAINKDADAPIMAMADYSLVGDLFEIVPQLTAALPDQNQ